MQQVSFFDKKRHSRKNHEMPLCAFFKKGVKISCYFASLFSFLLYIYLLFFRDKKSIYWKNWLLILVEYTRVKEIHFFIYWSSRVTHLKSLVFMLLPFSMFETFFWQALHQAEALPSRKRTHIPYCFNVCSFCHYEHHTCASIVFAERNNRTRGTNRCR